MLIKLFKKNLYKKKMNFKIFKKINKKRKKEQLLYINATNTFGYDLEAIVNNNINYWANI